MIQAALAFDAPAEPPRYAGKVAELRAYGIGTKTNAPTPVAFKVRAFDALVNMGTDDVPAAIMADRFADAMMRERARRGRDHTAPHTWRDMQVSSLMGYLVTPSADPEDVARKAFDWLAEAITR